MEQAGGTDGLELLAALPHLTSLSLQGDGVCCAPLALPALPRLQALRLGIGVGTEGMEEEVEAVLRRVQGLTRLVSASMWPAERPAGWPVGWLADWPAAWCVGGRRQHVHGLCTPPA